MLLMLFKNLRGMAGSWSFANAFIQAATPCLKPLSKSESPYLWFFTTKSCSCLPGPPMSNFRPRESTAVSVSVSSRSDKLVIRELFPPCSNHLIDTGCPFWHLPKWSDAKALHTNLTKTERWLIEAAYIRTEKIINVSPGFFMLHASVAERIKTDIRRTTET